MRLLVSAIVTAFAAPVHADEVCLDGGRFLMGSDEFYREEAPRRPVQVDPFCIDRYEVTRAEFAEFVKATGYQTTAETGPDRSHYPDAPDSFFTSGSAVFVAPKSIVGARLGQWWRFIATANWRAPRGEPLVDAALDDHPVVHVSFKDAAAYARWRGRSLPTEEQWEFAAQGGASGQEFAWDRQALPSDHANTWQGRFPVENLVEDGYADTAPVGSFPANGFGIHDMIGNVWEWTVSAMPPAASDRMRVIKGGSYLCAENYCLRFRPAARQAQDTGLGTSHIGFRTVGATPPPP